MNFNSNSITIKVDSVHKVNQTKAQRTSDYCHEETEKKAIALELLVAGRYNQHGRHIDIEKYQELRNRFEGLLSEISELI